MKSLSNPHTGKGKGSYIKNFPLNRETLLHRLTGAQKRESSKRLKMKGAFKWKSETERRGNGKGGNRWGGRRGRGDNKTLQNV